MRKSRPNADPGSIPVVVLAILLVLAVGAGLGTGLIRPMVPGGVHYESIVGIFVVMPILLLASWWIGATFPLRAAISFVAASVLLAWAGFAFGWIVAVRSLVDDMLGVAAGMIVASGVAAPPIVWAMRRLRVRVDPTLCPSCGYSRRGLAAGRCPECGEAFETADDAGTRGTSTATRAGAPPRAPVVAPAIPDASPSVVRAIAQGLAGVIAAGAAGALAGVLVDRAGVAGLVATLAVLTLVLAYSIVPAARLRAALAIALVGATITLEWIACAIGFDLVAGRGAEELVPVVASGLVLSLVFAASAIVPARMLR